MFIVLGSKVNDLATVTEYNYFLTFVINKLFPNTIEKLIRPFQVLQNYFDSCRLLRCLRSDFETVQECFVIRQILPKLED